MRMVSQVLNTRHQGRGSRPANVLNKAEVMKDVLRLGCNKQCYLLLIAYESEEASIFSSWHIIA
jgi:hypothetical protein